MIPNEPPAEIPERLVRNVEDVRTRIRRAALRRARDPDEITLVAVTKTVAREVAWMLPTVGLDNAGENRIPGAESKIPGAPASIRWHMIGHLQSNKARRAIHLFRLIHSVDSEKLLLQLDRIAGEESRVTEVLLQVNISDEDRKHGLRPEGIRGILERGASAKNLRVRGLMGMGPFTAEPEQCRPLFAGLRDLLAEANRGGWYREPMPELSMGMTNDFEVAVEEGATILRIGSALFDGVETGSGSAHNEEGV